MIVYKLQRSSTSCYDSIENVVVTKTAAWLKQKLNFYIEIIKNRDIMALIYVF